MSDYHSDIDNEPALRQPSESGNLLALLTAVTKENQTQRDIMRVTTADAKHGHEVHASDHPYPGGEEVAARRAMMALQRGLAARRAR